MINEEIYDKLKNNKKSYLYLTKCNLKNINKLSKFLLFNTSLDMICLSYNQIENIDKLAESLKFNSSLK